MEHETSTELKKYDVCLGVWLEDTRAKIPVVEYEGTSACFDLKCIEDTVIPANGSAMVPVGVRIIVPKGYYMEFATRSGHGIKHNLRVHPGIIDAGYSGELGVKIFNLSNKDYTMKEGKGCVQVKLHKVPTVIFREVLEDEFKQYSEESIRGENGFGSTDK